MWEYIGEHAVEGRGGGSVSRTRHDKTCMTKHDRGQGNNMISCMGDQEYK